MQIGILAEKYLSQLQKSYAPAVQKLADESHKTALMEKTAATIAVQEHSSQTDVIYILTDACHCWRRNAKFSDIVCIGDETQNSSRRNSLKER